MHATVEITFLVIPTGPPTQAAADVQVLAENMAHHVLGSHALGRAFVVRAAGSMNMVIARPPAALGRVDPALEGELFGVRRHPGDGDFFLQDEVFRTPRVADR